MSSLNSNFPDFIRFQHHSNIYSEDVKLISAFQMGGRSYLAIGGKKPQILVYQRGSFEPITILGSSYGLVEFFLPIPVRSYRDDLLLLVQHCLEFETHVLTVVDTLVWDGEAFKASIPVPCHQEKHISYGVNCMLDYQRTEGLKGATVLRRANEVYVVVPRYKAESGLYRFHTELLAQNSELIDIQNHYAFLKAWVKEHDDLIELAQRFIQLPDNPTHILADITQLNTLEAPELYFNGEVGHIYINEDKWTEEDSLVDINTLIEAMEELEKELSKPRLKRNVDEFESNNYEEYWDLEVESLFVNKLNNKTFYIQNEQLNFNGTVSVQNLTLIKEPPTRATRETTENFLEIEGDLEFNEINGIPWTDFVNNLVFTHQPLFINQLIVQGEIIIENYLNITTLNSLKFPADYLIKDDSRISIITAEKTFMGTLTANAVDVSGLINDVNPFEVITLTDEQVWHGNPIFSQLEITENCEINGTINGANRESIPLNPALGQANTINATCIFEHLNIKGSLYLNGFYDSVNLSALMQDLAQRPENPSQPIIVKGPKHFNSIEFPNDFALNKEIINNIPIHEFINKLGDEVLNMSALNGYIYFKNLQLKGSVDGVEIEEVVNNALRIDQPLFSLDTQLNFASGIIAKEIQILKTLNDIPCDQYQTINEDLIVPEVYFDVLESDTTSAKFNITLEENATLNAWNLTDVCNKVVENVYIEELILEQDLDVDYVNDLDVNILFKLLDHADELPEMILDGKIQVDSIVVNGNIHLQKLNGLDFEQDVLSNIHCLKTSHKKRFPLPKSKAEVIIFEKQEQIPLEKLFNDDLSISNSISINEANIQEKQKQLLATIGPLSLSSIVMTENFMIINALVRGNQNFSVLVTANGSRIIETPFYETLNTNTLPTTHLIPNTKINQNENNEHQFTQDWSPQIMASNKDLWLREKRFLRKPNKKQIFKSFEWHLTKYMSQIHRVFFLPENYLLVNLNNKNSILLKVHSRNKVLHKVLYWPTGLLKSAFLSKDKTILFCQNSDSIDLYHFHPHNLTLFKALQVNLTHLQQSSTDEMIYYGISEKNLYEVSALNYTINKFVELPAAENYNDYRFLPITYNAMPALCNTSHIVNVVYNNISILKLANRFLNDLIHQLKREIQITQLTIPESDLYNIDLATNFIAIIIQLYQQNSTFINHNNEEIKLHLPQTPAQVLAARSVVIIWPFLQEIQKLLKYNKGNTFCLDIVSHLKNTMQDIAASAFEDTQVANDENHRLMSVIERLTVLENNLNTARRAKNTTDSLDYNTQNVIVTHLENIQSDKCSTHNELLSSRVGSIFETQLLLISTGRNAINVFMGDRLLQKINVREPHSLLILHMGKETLLAYVEHCCDMRILFYSELKKTFLKFANVKLSKQITHLFNFEIKQDYYLAAVMSKTIEFFKIVIT